MQFLPGGRFVGHNVYLTFVLQQVYGVRDFQIVADSKWQAIIADGRDSRYYIEARGPGTASPEQLREMVKTLLGDRFGLRLHIEQRPFLVYALVVAEHGVKGARPRDGNPGGIAMMTAGWIHGERVEPAQLAEVLSRYVDRPVVDQTRLDQFLKFDLTWTPLDFTAAGGPAPEPGCPATFQRLAKQAGWKLEDLSCPPLFTALEEQLGLKLQAQNASLDVLAIDEVHQLIEN